MEMEIELENFNLTSNDTFDTNNLYAVTYPLIIRIMALIVSISSTTANVIIILTICKYDILHSRTYWYITNWCLCNVFITALLPYTFNSLGLQIIIRGEILCILDESFLIFLSVNQIFVAIIVIDWYKNTFSSQKTCTIRCRNYYKFIIGVVWIVLLSLVLITSSYCSTDRIVSYNVYTFIATYLGIFVLLIIMFIIRCFKLKTSSIVVEKNKLEFYLALAYFLSWLPNILVLMSSRALHRYLPLGVFDYLYNFSVILGFCYAVVFFIILYCYDRSFKIAVNSLFNIKRSDGDKETTVKQDLVEILEEN